jgi:hypothetical protein
MRDRSRGLSQWGNPQGHARSPEFRRGASSASGASVTWMEWSRRSIARPSRSGGASIEAMAEPPHAEMRLDCRDLPGVAELLMMLPSGASEWAS